MQAYRCFRRATPYAAMACQLRSCRSTLARAPRMRPAAWLHRCMAACGACACLGISQGLSLLVHIVAQAEVSGGQQADELDGEAQQAAGRQEGAGQTQGRGGASQKRQRRVR